MILLPLVNQAILDFLGSDRGKELALTPTLTSDHLVRTKALPLMDRSVPTTTTRQNCASRL